MGLAFPKQPATVRFNGRLYNVPAGEPWDADDPLVRAHPDLFDTEPAKVHRTTAGPVEQATAAPGERRTVRRRG